MLQVFDTNKFGLHIFGTRNGINDLYFHNFGFDSNIPIAQTNAIKNMTEAYGIHDMQSFFKCFPNNDEHYHLVFHDDLIAVTTITMISDASMNNQGVVQSRRQGHYGISLWFRNNLIPDSKKILDLLYRLKSSFESRFIDKNVGGIFSYISFDGFENELPPVNSICSPGRYPSKVKNSVYCTYGIQDMGKLDEVLEYLLKYDNNGSIFITKQENVSNLNLGRINATDKISELRYKKSKRDIRVSLQDNNGRAVNANVFVFIPGQPDEQPKKINGSGTITLHNPNDNAQVTYRVIPDDLDAYDSVNSPPPILLAAAVHQGISVSIHEKPYFNIDIQDNTGRRLNRSLYSASYSEFNIRKSGGYYLPKLQQTKTIKLSANHSGKSIDISLSRVADDRIQLAFPPDVELLNAGQTISSGMPVSLLNTLALVLRVGKEVFPEKRVEPTPAAPQPSPVISSAKSETRRSDKGASKPLFSVTVVSSKPAVCKLVGKSKGELDRNGNTYSWKSIPQAPITLSVSAVNHFTRRIENVKNGQKIELIEYVPIVVSFTSNTNITGVKFLYDVGETVKQELRVDINNKATLKLPKKDIDKPSYDITLEDDSNTKLAKKDYIVSIDGNSRTGKLELKKSGLFSVLNWRMIPLVLALLLIIAGGGYLATKFFTPDPIKTEVDSDGDGVIDSKDQCEGIGVVGKVDASGCPKEDKSGNHLPPGKNVDGKEKTALDSDGDGVIDSQDKCANTAVNTKVNSEGCPDSDGDGITELGDLDKCPNTPKGAKVDSKGCPDSDGDGVHNNDDQCPREGVKGKVDEMGCPLEPEIEQTNNKKTEAYLKTESNLKKQLNGKDFSNLEKLNERVSYLKRRGFQYNAEISEAKIDLFINVSSSVKSCMDGDKGKCDKCLEYLNNPLLSSDQKEYLFKKCSN